MRWIMVTFFSSLLSGIFATIVTLIVTNRQQKKRQQKDYKMQIFREVVAYLPDISDIGISTGNFQRAINQVFIAFSGCDDVIDKFEAFRKSTLSAHRDNNLIIGELLRLIKAMANELSIDYSFSNDDLFIHPIIIDRTPTSSQ